MCVKWSTRTKPHTLFFKNINPVNIFVGTTHSDKNIPTFFMQTFIKWALMCLLLSAVTALPAQKPQNTNTTPATGAPPATPTTPEEEEEDVPEQTEEDQVITPEDGPIDDVVQKTIMLDRKVLPYQPVRESDIMWEKRVWRVIDVREKMNLSFAYPEEPFFKILADAATKGDLPVYSTDEDGAKFKKTPQHRRCVVDVVQNGHRRDLRPRNLRRKNSDCPQRHQLGRRETLPPQRSVVL